MRVAAEARRCFCAAQSRSRPRPVCLSLSLSSPLSVSTCLPLSLLFLFLIKHFLFQKKTQAESPNAAHADHACFRPSRVKSKQEGNEVEAGVIRRVWPQETSQIVLLYSCGDSSFPPQASSGAWSCFHSTSLSCFP